MRVVLAAGVEGVRADVDLVRVVVHLSPEAAAMLVEAIGVGFLEARAANQWDGDERDVAVASLIALGVSQKKAERAVDRTLARRRETS